MFHSRSYDIPFVFCLLQAQQAEISMKKGTKTGIQNPQVRCRSKVYNSGCLGVQWRSRIAILQRFSQDNYEEKAESEETIISWREFRANLPLIHVTSFSTSTCHAASGSRLLHFGLAHFHFRFVAKFIKSTTTNS